MRYRRLSYAYVVTTRTWSAPNRPSVLPAHGWTPDADVFESSSEFVVTVEVAGVSEDDLELLLYPNALVVQGVRRPPTLDQDGVYHIAGIRYGPFRLEIPLAAAVSEDGVRAHLDRGMLTIHLPKAQEGRA